MARTAKSNTTEPSMTIEQMDGADTLEQPQPPATILDVVAGLEVMVARRLYEVWRTTGQLTDPKWDWHRQSVMAQHAWRCVARATMPRVQSEHFGVAEIAELNHG